MQTPDSPSNISFKVDLALKKLGKIIEIGFINPKELKNADSNSRVTEISQAEKDEMDLSVTETGIVNPLVININNGIVKGQLRWHSAMRVGEATVPFVRMVFNNLFAELIASANDEALHHPWNAHDWAIFIEKCLMECNRDYAQVATALGQHETTIRAKIRGEYIPEVIRNKPDTVKKFKELNVKKKNAVRTILEADQFKNNEEEAEELIDYSLVASHTDIGEVRKTTKDKIPVNLKRRKAKIGKSTLTLSTKLPRNMVMLFRNKCKTKHKDPDVVVEELVKQYIES